MFGVFAGMSRITCRWFVLFFSWFLFIAPFVCRSGIGRWWVSRRTFRHRGRGWQWLRHRWGWRAGQWPGGGRTSKEKSGCHQSLQGTAGPIKLWAKLNLIALIPCVIMYHFAADLKNKDENYLFFPLKEKEKYYLPTFFNPCVVLQPHMGTVAHMCSLSLRWTSFLATNGQVGPLIMTPLYFTQKYYFKWLCFCLCLFHLCCFLYLCQIF